MPTVTRTWTFATTTEGLADAGNSSTLTFSASGSGNPASSIQFASTTGNESTTEYARAASSQGFTWETWGVPAGATVTQLRISNWDKRLQQANRLTSWRIRFRVIDSAGVSVTAGNGDPGDYTPSITANTSWSTDNGGASPLVNVVSGRQASTTDVRLEIQVDIVMGTGTSPNFQLLIDNIDLEITYTTGGGTTVTLGNAATTGAAAMAATMTVLHRMTAATTGAGSSSATLRQTHHFSGAVTGSASASATLRQSHAFTAAVTGAVAVAAVLRQTHYFSTAISAAGSMVAAIYSDAVDPVYPTSAVTSTGALTVSTSTGSLTVSSSTGALTVTHSTGALTAVTE